LDPAAAKKAARLAAAQAIQKEVQSSRRQRAQPDVFGKWWRFISPRMATICERHKKEIARLFEKD